MAAINPMDRSANRFEIGKERKRKRKKKEDLLPICDVVDWRRWFFCVFFLVLSQRGAQ